MPLFVAVSVLLLLDDQVFSRVESPEIVIVAVPPAAANEVGFTVTVGTVQLPYEVILFSNCVTTTSLTSVPDTDALGADIPVSCVYLSTSVAVTVTLLAAPGVVPL